VSQTGTGSAKRAAAARKSTPRVVVPVANGAAASEDTFNVGSRSLSDIAEEARSLGMRRAHILAWRDLEDPEAGGSEIHAHRIASLWASAGIDVTMRTSRAEGLVELTQRDGYEVVRRAGRYAVFPRSASSEILHRGRRDGLVEIWNGMPFFSPLWAAGPRVVFLHHVHAEMWQMTLTLTPRLAALGRFVEQSVAPPLYRNSRIITLSGSSRSEIVSMLKMNPDRVSVVPPGVDARFSPGGVRSDVPLLMAVGRLVPVKRFDALIDALAKVKAEHPQMRAVIVGEGYERGRLLAQRREIGAEDWLDMPGKLSVEELVDLYRSAWLLVSASLREGWGMTVTEAAACGTPAVATRIAGHIDAIDHGRSGLLVDDPTGIASAASDLISDPEGRARLCEGAKRHAAGFNWEATASGTLAVLVDEARRSRRDAAPRF
jgi:glycosyltransferase involved in cell wall biosynthesis